MHERQAAVAVVTLLFFSIIFTSDSFAQVPQCNGLDATHVGTEDKDKIRGTSGDDVIVGLGGNDVIYGKGGNDVICGGAGNDKLFGNSGNDILLGEIGYDKLYGGQGIDTCDSSSDDKRVISCETPHIQTIVSDTSDDLQKQIANLQNQINSMILGLISWTDIQGIPESLADGDDDMLGNIKCDAEQILVFDGLQWICGDNASKTESIPMSFHFSTVGVGRTEWVGTSTTVFNENESQKPEVIITTSGVIKNLIAMTTPPMTLTPPDPESYSITLLKNGQPTSLTCIISNGMEMCQNIESEVSVDIGDTIVLKVEASPASPFAIIRSSVLFSSV